MSIGAARLGGAIFDTGPMAMETMTLTQPVFPHYGERQRRIVAAVNALAGVGAIVVGAGLIGGWIGMSTSYLADTPFDSYLIPGLLLIVIVGGALLIASYLAATRSNFALQASLASGFMLLGWISFEIMLIGMVNWLQPLMGATGVAIALMAVIYSRR
jgi:hypothetical protein